MRNVALGLALAGILAAGCAGQNDGSNGNRVFDTPASNSYTDTSTDSSTTDTTASPQCNVGDCAAEAAKGGYLVYCADGGISNAGGISGACSDHGGVAGPVSGSSTDTSSTPPPSSGDQASTTTVPSTTPSDVTGQDANGYNQGPGCSDDPTNPLPGCSDAPTIPGNDPAGTCTNGITVDAKTTSCSLAESIYSNYTGDGPVTGHSDVTHQDYTLTCATAGPGTSGFTFCTGNAGRAEIYMRWHQ